MSYFHKGDIYTLLHHPFKDHFPPLSKYLIIGTFPAHKRNFEFYYSGEGNRFWEILTTAYEQNLKYFSGIKAIEERKNFLSANLIAMTDMHQLCYRKNNSSGDEHLYPVFLNDIFALLDNNKTIDTLVLTSRTDAVGALGLFKIYFMQKGISIPEFQILKNNLLYSTFRRNEKTIDIYVPISPSKRIEDYPTKKLVEMYKYIFTD